MKEYRLESRVTYWLFVAVMPCFFVGVGCLWIWIATSRPAQEGPSALIGVVWLVLVLWGCRRQVTMPHSIEVLDTGVVRFVGAFRVSSVAPVDVISIRSVGGSLVQVKHRGGKILLLPQFTGFHEFLTELKRANPNVVIRGL